MALYKVKFSNGETEITNNLQKFLKDYYREEIKQIVALTLGEYNAVSRPL